MKMRLFLGIMIVWSICIVSNLQSAVFVHKEFNISPSDTDQHIADSSPRGTVVANGGRYRFTLILPGYSSEDDKWIYTSKWKYKKSSIGWETSVAGGLLTLEPENGYNKKAVWQTPALESGKNITITVKGERWPIGPGGSGPYDPNWSSGSMYTAKKMVITFTEPTEDILVSKEDDTILEISGLYYDGGPVSGYRIDWSVASGNSSNVYMDSSDTLPYSKNTGGSGNCSITLSFKDAVEAGDEFIIRATAAETTTYADSPKITVGFKVEITDVYGIGSTDKFIPLSGESTKNRATVKYKIIPQNFQLDSVKIQVFKNDGASKVYEQTYTDASHTKYTGTDLTIEWNGTDNQTSNDYADPEDNIHKIKLVGAKLIDSANDVCETSPLEDINVVPLIVKVFPTHSLFGATAVAPQELTITTVVKGRVDDTGNQSQDYRYYTESGSSLDIWDGNHYYDNNSSSNYPGTPLSYWIELLNYVNLEPDIWDEDKLGNLDYTWFHSRGPNGDITDPDNDGIASKTFSNPGTDVYRVTVTNKVGTTNLQQMQSPAEQDISSPQTVTFVENINDAYMVHLREDNTNDAYSWATSFLTTPYHQKSAPKDYHEIDCSGLVHAANQLKGWSTVSNTQADVFLTSSSYSSALGSINPTDDIGGQRNDWVGIDAKTGGGGFDGTWGHITIVYEYEFVESYTLTNGQKYKFIHARGSTGVEKNNQATYPVNPQSGTAWNIIFRRPNQ